VEGGSAYLTLDAQYKDSGAMWGYRAKAIGVFNPAECKSWSLEIARMICFLLGKCFKKSLSAGTIKDKEILKWLESELLSAGLEETTESSTKFNPKNENKKNMETFLKDLIAHTKGTEAYALAKYLKKSSPPMLGALTKLSKKAGKNFSF
jgi:hypothetical protein